MNRILLIGVILLHHGLLFGQNSISGSILDEERGNPLVGATIVLNETFIATSSNEEGKFKLGGLEPAEYQIKVSFIGFEDYLDTVDLNGDLELEIELRRSNKWTDEVIVSATRAGKETPTTHQEVSKDYLEKNNFGQDVPYLLQWTPSIVTTSDAGNGIGYTSMRIRGSDQTRINVTINGIPYNDAESQGVFWVDIPDMAASTQNLQIQRGVGTSTNGAGAFGGTVNLQTLNVDSDPYGQLEASVGSFNTRKLSAQAGTGLIKDHWQFEGRYSAINSDGFVDRASSELRSYYGSGAYIGKKMILKMIAFGGREKTYQSWYGIDSATLENNRTQNNAGLVTNPDGSTRFYYDNQVDNYSQDHFQLHYSHQLGTGLTLNAAAHYTYGRGYFEEYMDVNQGWETNLDFYGIPPVIIRNDPFIDTINDTDLIRRKWLDNDFYGFTSSLDYTRGRSNIVFGLAASQYDGRHFGEVIWARYASNSEIRHRYYDNTGEKSDFTTYLKWTYSLRPRLSIFADLQYRGVSYKVNGIDEGPVNIDLEDDFHFFNPKLGLSYSLNDFANLYFSLAVGNKEPNRSDYLDNLHQIKPKAETLYDFELGYRRRGINAAYEVVGYFMYYQNQLVLTGELNNVGFPIRENVGKSYRAGIELVGQFNFHPKFRWVPNLTFSTNQNLDYNYQDAGGALVSENTPIAFSPQIIAASDFTWLPLNGMEFTLLSKYVGDQNLTNTNNDRLKLDPYFVNDLRFRLTFPVSGMREIGFTILINNVLDTEYVSNGYVFFGSPYYFPQAGRNFLFGVRAKF